MRIFDIINNVDWNKNIIFLVLYITIVVLCVFLYLTPLMDTYKSTIMEYRKTNILDNQINVTLDKIKGNEDSILRENLSVFERLSRKITAKELQKYAMSFISGVKVNDLGITNAENGIKIHSFKITGQTKSISNLKNLLGNLSALQNSVRIAFPIIISKDEKRKILGVEITLMVYNSSRDISKIKAEQSQETQEVATKAPESKAQSIAKPNATSNTKAKKRPKNPQKQPKAKAVKSSAKTPKVAKSSKSSVESATEPENVAEPTDMKGLMDADTSLQAMDFVQTTEVNADSAGDLSMQDSQQTTPKSSD